MTPAPPRSSLELELEQLQSRVTRGELANERRRQVILSLFANGMTQGEIAARLTRASVQAGGETVTLAAVEHIVRRWRRHR